MSDKLQLLFTSTCSKCRGSAALLEERGVEYAVRNYFEDSLTPAELQAIVKKLGVPAADLLRRGDPAFAELGLTGNEPDAVLIEHMAANPGLMNRPIAIRGDRAVLARPPERVLELLD